MSSMLYAGPLRRAGRGCFHCHIARLRRHCIRGLTATGARREYQARPDLHPCTSAWRCATSVWAWVQCARRAAVPKVTLLPIVGAYITLPLLSAVPESVSGSTNTVQMASANSPLSSTSAMASPDPMQQDLSWLSRLSSQPVFASASASSSTPRGQTNMITRGSDIIVLIDGQLRMMSLSAVKNGKADGSDASVPPLSSYKVRNIGRLCLRQDGLLTFVYATRPSPIPSYRKFCRILPLQSGSR